MFRYSQVAHETRVFKLVSNTIMSLRRALPLAVYNCLKRTFWNNKTYFYCIGIGIRSSIPMYTLIKAKCY